MFELQLNGMRHRKDPENLRLSHERKSVRQGCSVGDPLREKQAGFKQHMEQDHIVHDSWGDSMCQHPHSRAQDNSILQTLLEVRTNRQTGESLDPAAEFRLLLRVIFGLKLEEQRAQGWGENTPSRSSLKLLMG